MELRNVISQRYSLYDDWRNYEIAVHANIIIAGFVVRG